MKPGADQQAMGILDSDAAAAARLVVTFLMWLSGENHQ
jgi:hypothetical protein